MTCFVLEVMYATNHGCRLRSKRFISDGLCTSPKPISEVVCAESCVTPSQTHIHNSQHAVIKNQTSKHAVSNNKNNITEYSILELH